MPAKPPPCKGRALCRALEGLYRLAQLHAQHLRVIGRGVAHVTSADVRHRRATDGSTSAPERGLIRALICHPDNDRGWHVHFGHRTLQGHPSFVAIGADNHYLDRAVHRIETESFHGVCPVLIRHTWVKDNLVRYRKGDAIGYGILEHGYREGDVLAELV